jgi:cytochrome c oxidase subunit 2
VQKWWSVLFGAVLLASFGLFVVAAFVPGWWLPVLANADSFGWDVDYLFYLILALTGFFFVLTEAILVYNMWTFAAKPGRKPDYVHGNHRLEMLWTIVPAAILLFIAFAQISAWNKIKLQSRMPNPDQVLEVSARQFEWRMRYPTDENRQTMHEEWAAGKPQVADAWGRNTFAEIDDLHIGNEVHTWLNADTRIYLKTRDVLHSFFLPNMRLKQDAVPGKTIPVWFKPTLANAKWNPATKKVDTTEIWELACAELCGWGHYKMQGRLYVHESYESYKAWLEHLQEEEHRRSR